MYRTDISLVDVLLHFRDMPDLKKFGILGFHRLNGRDTSKRAYKRTHVVSTVLLNLSKLKGIEYHWRAHVWEDLQFNRDVELNRDEGKRAVLCKCYRFGFSSPQIHQGGCADIVARPRGQTTDDELPFPAEEPDIVLDEDSTVEDVARWVRSLKKLKDPEKCAQTLIDMEIDGDNIFNNDLQIEHLERHGLPTGAGLKILRAMESLRAGAAGPSPAAASAGFAPAR